MTTIYLSSTYTDLKAHREAVYKTLRKMRYDVIAMEDYIATDQRPVEKCLTDVAASDLYIGLFAWRYGFIPAGENPEHKSITELEYRTAKQTGKHCLIFLVDKDAPWPPQQMDAVTDEGNRGEYISALRRELAQEKVVGFFTTPEHLASLVGPSVYDWEVSRTTSGHARASALLNKHQSERTEREARLHALLTDDGGFMHDRLESFVGREKELVEIRQRIDQHLQTGGYVTITGQAGQGKSSIIAKLVQEYGVENVAFHFIPLNPGPDHQVGLLRNVMARLILKYGLSDLYVASDNRAALKEYFPKVLKEVVEQGGREVIFIDGLDQLQEDLTGIRDLSFLPVNPPPGIVFVLGTRPDDTLKPLELLNPRQEYKLPKLSRQDFDLILRHRQVVLEQDIVNIFYQTMQENALYLDLVAKELRENSTVSPQEMITRIAHNPENIFTVSMVRLKRPSIEWREVLKPVLGILLVAREPLSLWQIRHILQLEDDRLREGITRLGGLVVETGQAGQRCYSLFHMKFQDYLQQDEEQPEKEYIFTPDEVEHWHATLAAWCEGEQLSLIWDETIDPGEQSRREYARQHYVTHLYYARNWQRVFSVLDEGTYGRAKIRFDPSTRLYAKDLDLGRKAAAWAGWTQEEGLEHLAYLWRYTLLRCSLASLADRYPTAAFRILTLMKQNNKALNLAELLTDQAHKVYALIGIALNIGKQSNWSQESIQVLLRSCEIAQKIEDNNMRAKIFHKLVLDLNDVGQDELVKSLLDHALDAIKKVDDIKERAELLIEHGNILMRMQQKGQALMIFEQAKATSLLVEKSWSRSCLLIELSKAFIKLQDLAKGEELWSEVHRIIPRFEEGWMEAYVLSKLTEAMILMKQREEVEEIWVKVEQIINLLPNDWPREWALSAFSEALIQSDQWEKAKTISNLFDMASAREEALIKLSNDLIRHQRFEEAEDVIDIMDSDWRKDDALQDLIQALVHVQRWEQAKKILKKIRQINNRVKALCDYTEALMLAEKWDLAMSEWEAVEDQIQTMAIQPMSKEFEALGELGTALAQEQQWTQAEMIIRSIGESVTGIKALLDLSAILGQAGLLQRAEEIWQEVEETLSRIILSRSAFDWVITDIQGELVKKLVQFQCWDKANAILKKIEMNRNNYTVLCELGTIFLQEGRRIEATAIWTEVETRISKTKTDAEEAWMLIALGKALAQAGDLERASHFWERVITLTHTMKKIDEYDEKESLLAEIGESWAELHQWERTNEILDMMDEGGEKAGVLCQLTKALGQAQEWNRAETMINMIGEDWIRVKAQSELGEILWKKGFIEKAKFQWQEAEEIITKTTSMDRWFKGNALCDLSIAIASVGEHRELLSLVQRWWLQADTREYAIKQLAMASGLLHIKPDLGTIFFEAFTWVDNFLRHGSR